MRSRTASTKRGALLAVDGVVEDARAARAVNEVARKHRRRARTGARLLFFEATEEDGDVCPQIRSMVKITDSSKPAPFFSTYPTMAGSTLRQVPNDGGGHYRFC